jgi:putative hydrolase of the HAD superfamily
MNKFLKLPASIKALAFDMDDTLIAFDAVTHKSWQQMVNKFCSEGKFKDTTLLFKTILETSAWYWNDEVRHREGRKNLLKARTDMVIIAFQKLNLSKEDAIKVAQEYSELRDTNVFIYDGAYEVLEKARQSGYKLALITNGQGIDQRKKIERFNLEPYFDHIMVEGELGYGKPEKKFYIELLQRLKEPADNIAIIGDNYEWEVSAPKTFGFFTVWHDWKKRGIPDVATQFPDIIIENISQVKDFF